MQDTQAFVNDPVTWIVLIAGLIVLFAVIGFVVRSVRCMIRLAAVIIVLVMVLALGAMLLGR